ncbi:MAG TPA: thioesterase family protein [Acidimicrobiales bacterium]|nr:thioesterase family protein [Acidimicrobiales bacterium]
MGFFTFTGKAYAPLPHARSPWSAQMLHGRLLAGLAAHEAERHHLDGGFVVARFTIDLFRAVPMRPVAVRAARVREGRRVRAVDVAVTCDGEPVARAVVLLLVPPGPPPGRVWGRPPWRAPDPSELPAPPRTAEADGMGAPDMRFIGQPLAGPGPYEAWLREPWPLVEGEGLTPVARAVMAADVTNPLSNWGDEGLHYINADLTVCFARPPIGEWIGLEVTDHLDAGGIAVGQSRLHDRGGPFAIAAVSAVAQTFGARQ